jgi:hypothetical protein
MLKTLVGPGGLEPPPRRYERSDPPEKFNQICWLSSQSTTFVHICSWSFCGRLVGLEMTSDRLSALRAVPNRREPVQARRTLIFVLLLLLPASVNPASYENIIVLNDAVSSTVDRAAFSILRRI